jgi:20S proteasome subunit beta 7
MRPVKPSFHQSTAPQNTHSQATPVQHTQNPKIVGTSVLGMKYKDGIVLAADNLGSIPISQIYLKEVTNRSIASFGSLARFKDVQRIFPVGDNTLIAYSGDVSDAQHIQYLLETLMSVSSFYQAYI